ncbi:acyl transferase/acyl hydrolase/lysophospholipase [Thermothelomyces heterothallicus CBS 202.75]|uniref:acyl transferase/acyl hydrolase/lysophospholipase n=1 Tax=Thermothelomyces heterothallicus CBS 202.75 TaxID=1149848 RepID=UPI003744749B
MALHIRNLTHLNRPKLPTSSRQQLGLFAQGNRPRLTNTGLGLSFDRRLPRRCLFSSPLRRRSTLRTTKLISVTLTSALLPIWLYPTDALQHTDSRAELASGNSGKDGDGANTDEDQGAWASFTRSFSALSFVPSTDGLSEKVVELMPEWAKFIPGYVRKLQREMNMEPGSLAANIWHEAQDPYTHPEIQYQAKVRVSGDLCEDEKIFLDRRKKMIVPALARYLGIDERDIHPDDVPTIAMCGSGGGLRALVAGTGSFLATTEDGLFDCTTYLSGVSGSCWLQSLYYSSVTGANFQKGIDHLKARLGTHIAYPPVAFHTLTSSPTNKYLLSGLVEKLKGDPQSQFGLVDIYGMLLAARLLVPKGELGVNEKDFKLSNQREYTRYGQNPLPIYTAVRHEIPELDSPDYGGPGSLTEEAKNRAKREAWFQWFEITPYEFFCEEFSAGIPTWAVGRKFKNGADLPSESGFRLPETRLPLLLGIWGSAFCATLSHYYREIRPIIKSLAGFQPVDELIWGHNKDLSKVHPIEPASIPNFVHGMYGQLPESVPQAVYDNEYIQLMDAGMSNNLPIYPLLRPGRDVDIVVAFDASADIKTDNWLSAVEGYARQRNIKGWPVGIGWPKPKAAPSVAAAELEQAQAHSAAEAEGKITQAKADQAARHPEAPGTTTAATASPTDSDQQAPELPGPQPAKPEAQRHSEAATELGYCTVWVGTTQERSSDHPPPPPVDDTSTWRLMEPDAGITVVYLPFLANERAAPGVDVATSDYLSTWNFVYTPDQIDQVIALARANYGEGRERIRATVRAVYERKRRRREERERKEETAEWTRQVGKGVAGAVGEEAHGDHFS